MIEPRARMSEIPSERIAKTDPLRLGLKQKKKKIFSDLASKGNSNVLV